MKGYIEVSSWIFVAKYCAYVFIAVIGMMQIIAAKWELKGISFFRDKKWSYIFGTLAIIAVFVWYFGFSGLNLMNRTFDTPPQLLWLAISVLLALLITFGLSSLINRLLPPTEISDKTQSDGIEMLKNKTYWQACSRYFHRGGSR